MRIARLGWVGYVGGLVLGLGVVLTYGAMEVSSTPAFCGSCHVMNPYYESWQSSEHAHIACVECHMPSGVTAGFRKKYEALARVTSYVTGTYGTNPWTEVEDEACLECHERRLLGGQKMFGDVLFDHSPHLTELEGGKRLRCTSCHSQVVQGSHIAVVSSNCTLCHFKDQVPNQGTARCILCHRVADQAVDADGVQFDHVDVAGYGMKCEACHAASRGSDAGRVPSERCLVCHNESDKLAKLDDTHLLHQSHVTEHKVECTNCHLEIEHVSSRHLEPAQSGCATCHDLEHSAQLNLYAGIGGKGLEPQPDVMYRAQVRCEGCHFDHGANGTWAADEVSCMNCHGPGYRKIFLLWKATLDERTAAVRRRLDTSEPRLRDASTVALADARANLELVERGHGMHNLPYSLALLDAAHRQLNEARVAGGLEELSVPWDTVPYRSSCLTCHAGVESVRVQVFARAFPHQPHVIGEGLACLRCHTTHEERTEVATALKIGAADCDACHRAAAAADPPS